MPPAMARNILDVLDGDRAAMGDGGARKRTQFSWDRSMEILFDDVYPKALAPGPGPGGWGAGSRGVHARCGSRLG